VLHTPYLPRHLVLIFFQGTGHTALSQFTHSLLHTVSSSSFLLLGFRLITICLHNVEVTAFFASNIRSFYFIAVVNELGEFLETNKKYVD
jgi:hypothetical protein